MDFDGEGEILRVESGPITGVRNYRLDKDSGDILDENYSSLPTNYVIRRVGQVAKKLALTFDDGPDPEWTPQILDILKAKHVPATFFVIGANMEAHPGLVQRILREGHEVGNHTYTHPNLADTPLPAVRLELNATQRLFEALTGRSMRLLRPPYLGDAEPSDADEIVPIEEAQKLGYVTIGTHVDTLDWQMLPVDQMMALVLKEVSDPNPDARGNIILLHDSGGDRSQTVKLLPELIDTMRARGFSFVPVSELGGFTREQVMPAQPLTVMLYENRVVFLTLSFLGQALYYCFLAAIILGVGRLFMLCGLAVFNRLRKKTEPAVVDGGHPVTVLIPAFNEEKVIVSTIERILASDYRELEVLVIDDGSKDHTAYIVRSHFMRDRRVGVISIPNGGKANALNVGLSNARGEVVVALDADTQFNPDTISRLVRWFGDPKVGAVAGNAKVGNRINIITRWQALEYIVAQNLERRALAALDTLTVVPGAVGAWRRAALERAGRLSRRHAGRRPGPDHRHPGRRLSRAVRFQRHCLDRGARHGQRPRQAALPLGLRHAAMPVEIPPHHLQPEIPATGHDRAAAGLAVPDFADHPGAAGRSAAGLAAGRDRGSAICSMALNSRATIFAPSASITASSSWWTCWPPLSAF